ncbi:MAG: polyprenol phosphomannose-dependent alpha 1,6 mannosyltransferase MptB, partial [Propionibacteriaceae bacterium]|nr:polyprenol phosphomannose-dependent alpha 1,6 mannosyltransferase MptB [Propionibacteriaceae bacterium]
MPVSTLPRRLVADLATAWGVRAVRQGLVGTFLIAVGALSPAYLPRVSPWWAWLTPLHANGTVWRIGGTLLTMLGALVLVDAWFRLRPANSYDDEPPHPWPGLRAGLRHWWAEINTAAAPVAVGLSQPLACRGWAALFWWSLPLLVAPPVFSQDAYSYAAQGWIVHNGLDPYAVGPGMLPGGFADQVASEWRMTPAPYGPLSLRISQLLVAVCGYSPYLSAWAERLPALLGVLMLGIFLPRIARQMRVDEHFVAWFALLNPMLVISFIGGAHNDALMMGFVAVGLWVAGRGLNWFRTRADPATGAQDDAFGATQDDALGATQDDAFGATQDDAFGATQNDGETPTRHPARSVAKSQDLANLWWLLGAVIVGIGATVKQPALLAALALPLITRPWTSWAWRDTLTTIGRVLASLATATATFILVSFGCRLGFGWVNSVSVPGRSLTVAPFTLLGVAVEHVAGWFGIALNQDHTLAIARGAGIAFG